MSAKKGVTNTLVWILMGLLIVGLGGFGVTNLQGNLDRIGRVGETELDANDFTKAFTIQLMTTRNSVGANRVAP